MNLKYYLRGLGLGIIVTAVVMGIAAGGKKTGLTDAEIKARARELGMTEKTVLSDNRKEAESDNGKEAEKEPEEGIGPENSDQETVKTPETEAQEEKFSTGQDDKIGQGGKEAQEDGVSQDDKVTQDDEAEQDDKTGKDDKTGPETAAGQNGADSPAGKLDEAGGQSGISAEETGSKRPGAGGTAEPVVFMINRGDGSYTVSDGLEKAGLVSSAAEFDHFLVENGYDKKIVAGEHMIPPDADGEMIAKIITGQE